MLIRHSVVSIFVVSQIPLTLLKKKKKKNPIGQFLSGLYASLGRSIPEILPFCRQQHLSAGHAIELRQQAGGSGPRACADIHASRRGEKEEKYRTGKQGPR